MVGRLGKKGALERITASIREIADELRDNVSYHDDWKPYIEINNSSNQISKEDALKEYMSFLEEIEEEEKKVIIDAKNDGTWIGGLGNTNAKLKELDERKKKKFKELKSQVKESYDT